MASRTPLGSSVMIMACREAENPATPLIQRVRFLGIYSSNQDEFYRVRVADVRRLAGFSSGGRKEHFDGLLGRINQRVVRMQRRFDAVYKQLLTDLAKNRIYLIDETQQPVLVDERQLFVSSGYGKGCVATVGGH